MWNDVYWDPGQSVHTGLNEHGRSLRLCQLNLAAVRERDKITNHSIDFEETTVLAKENSYWTQKIHKAKEIHKWPNNLNRDYGYGLPISSIACLSKQNSSRT